MRLYATWQTAVSSAGLNSSRQFTEVTFRQCSEAISARGELNSERILVSARRGYDLIVAANAVRRKRSVSCDLSHTRFWLTSHRIVIALVAIDHRTRLQGCKPSLQIASG